jgi:hypothetical protein
VKVGSDVTGNAKKSQLATSWQVYKCVRGSTFVLRSTLFRPRPQPLALTMVSIEEITRIVVKYLRTVDSTSINSVRTKPRTDRPATE